MTSFCSRGVQELVKMNRVTHEEANVEIIKLTNYANKILQSFAKWLN